jgi:Zn-dependent protease with chaperone function
LFFLILLPFTTLVFPFLAFHITTSLVNFNLSADWQKWKHHGATKEQAALSDRQEIAIATTLTLLTLTAASLRYGRDVRRLTIEPSGGRRYLAPKGNTGSTLTVLIRSLWSQVARQSTPSPDVLWFPSAAVLARAMTPSGRLTIAVSAGLWEKIETDDSIAKIVLLHELAHLAYRDPPTFIRLEALSDAATRILRQMLRVLIFIVLFLVLHQLIANHNTHAGAATIVRQTLMIVGIGFLTLLICPVSAAIIRRYIGLITSLIELRADVRSAEWAGGLQKFAEILSRHPLVHRSTLSDRAHSWFSLELTHLSESERIRIVSSSERLLTPKVQYFFLSLCLVLLLPLNGVTPLFEGGIVDLAAVITVATALSVALCTMFVLAGGTSTRIRLLRLFTVSACAVLFTAACQINLYTLTYSLSTIAVEFGLPNQGTVLRWDEASSVLMSAFHDIGGQLGNIWSGGWVVVSVLITMAALGGLRIVARGLRRTDPVTGWLVLVAGATGLGVMIDGYDPWRAFVVENTLLGRAFVGWASITTHFRGIRFTLGPCLALASMLILSTASRWIRGERKADRMLDTVLEP